MPFEEFVDILLCNEGYDEDDTFSVEDKQSNQQEEEEEDAAEEWEEGM